MKLINSEEKINKPLVWLEISKKNLLNNIRQIEKLITPVKIMAIIKVNAYGAGAVGVAKIIEEKVSVFGVVGIKEALSLRNGGITKSIINLGVYCFEDSNELIRNKIQPVIFTFSALKNFNNASQRLKKVAKIWIKVDTGLSRLGMPWEDALALIKTAISFKALKIEGVFSALSEDKKFDQVQLARFLSLKNEIEKLKINIPNWSLASSQAVFFLPQARLNVTRIGILLLGFYPSVDARKFSKIKLKPAVSFKTRIICIKELKKGESVFYRQRFVAKKKTRIALLPSGYAYGLEPSLIKGGEVLICGKKYPLVGGISATNAYVDIGNDGKIKANDEAVIFGTQAKKEITLEEICRLIGQNEYQFLGRIPEKVERIFI